MINRMRAALLELFPALEVAFDYSKKAPLILLSGYQTPDAIRRTGATRLAAWLKKRGCRGSTSEAAKALNAADARRTMLRAEAMGSQLVAQIAQQIAVIDAAISQLDEHICERFEHHPDAPITVANKRPFACRPRGPHFLTSRNHAKPAWRWPPGYRHTRVAPQGCQCSTRNRRNGTSQLSQLFYIHEPNPRAFGPESEFQNQVVQNKNHARLQRYQV